MACSAAPRLTPVRNSVIFVNENYNENHVVLIDDNKLDVATAVDEHCCHVATLWTL